MANRSDRPLKLKSLQLVNYKGFKNHSVSFRKSNVLLGANNAGKSTILGALRLFAAILPQARRLAPTEIGQYRGQMMRGWGLTSTAIDTAGFTSENIRFDFRTAEARIELQVTGGARLAICWEDVSDADDGEMPPRGVLFAFPPSGSLAKPRAVAQTMIPDIGIVPTLVPLDDREKVVSDETIRRNASSRRASRYFRNSLARLNRDEYDDYTNHVLERTPEISSLVLRIEGDEYDLFYSEQDSRHERELAWAGDGIQIWLQVLYHLWRYKNHPVLLLDEPDVFLHPDLQRRLAREVTQRSDQAIIATHSAEILAEAAPGSAVWVDRGRRASERPRSSGALGLLGRRLGSGFELGVGRALRSRTVLFVEGDDAPILASLAQATGYRAIAGSDQYATVPLGGFTRNGLASAFAETMSAIGSDVASVVLLDSDLRDERSIAEELHEVRDRVTSLHVWKRRELENYLLVPAVIARISSVSAEVAELLLQEAVEKDRDAALITLQTERVAQASGRGIATKTALEQARSEFDEAWSSAQGRLSVVDAKAVISSINQELQSRKRKTLNVISLARAFSYEDLAEELAAWLNEFEAIIIRT